MKTHPARQTKPVEAPFEDREIAILESVHDTSFVMQWRQDPYDKVLLIWRGRGELFLNRADKASLEVSSPCLVTIGRGTLHRLEDHAGQSISLHGLCLKNRPLLERETRHSLFGTVRHVSEPFLVGEADRLMRRILFEFRMKKPGFEGVMEALSCLLLTTLSRKIQAGGVLTWHGRRSRMQAYLEELDTRFWEQESLDAAAASVGLSRRSFSSLVKELTGESWLQRVRRLRLEHAQRLLRETELPAKAVAFESGFQDLSHFYRFFKRSTRQTPERFRQNARSRTTDPKP